MCGPTKEMRKALFKHAEMVCMTALSALLGSGMGHAKVKCDVAHVPNLPDVKITSVTTESAPAPRCKVIGVIGRETDFELLRWIECGEDLRRSGSAFALSSPAIF